MRTFRWLSANEIPPACDLRRCGWKMIGDDGGAAGVALAHAGNLDAAGWLLLLGQPGPWQRRGTVLVGVEDATERARLFHLGFGEVLGEIAAIGELEARAMRVAENGGWLPARRVVGPMTLDLLARDGFVHDRPLGLHPREFSLLWRLAETPGTRVAKRTLLADVWRLGFVPETNSLAVHVFRLRSRLAQAGLANVIATDPDDGYMLVIDPRARQSVPPASDGELEGALADSGDEEQHRDA